MSWIHLDAWGQRENETPPELEETETETQTVEVNLTFEYEPDRQAPPDEWIWEHLLDVDSVKAKIINET